MISTTFLNDVTGWPSWTLSYLYLQTHYWRKSHNLFPLSEANISTQWS